MATDRDDYGDLDARWLGDGDARWLPIIRLDGSPKPSFTVGEVTDLLNQLLGLPKHLHAELGELHQRLVKFVKEWLRVELMRDKSAWRHDRIERVVLDGKEFLLKEGLAGFDIIRARAFERGIHAVGWKKTEARPWSGAAAAEWAAEQSKGMPWEGGPDTMWNAYRKFRNALPERPPG